MEASRGGERVDDLLAPEGHLVLDGHDTRDPFENLGDIQCRSLERRRIGAEEPQRKVSAERTGAPRSNREALGSSRKLDAFLPIPEKFLVAHLARIRCSQRHLKGAELVRGRSAALAFRAMQGDRQNDQLALIECALGFPKRFVEVIQERVDPGARCARGEARVCRDDLTLGCGEEDEAQATAGQKADSDDQGSRRNGDGGEPMVNGDRRQGRNIRSRKYSSGMMQSRISSQEAS